MLKKFEVSNFRNFKDTITIDFGKTGGYHFNQDCVHNQLISKMVIYGRNATGKTNLGEALFDINKILGSFYMIRSSDRGVYLNGDSDKAYAQFVYVFQFDSSEVTYRYRRTDEYSLVDEEFLLNDSRCFYCNYVTEEFSFTNLHDLEAETAAVERFLQSLNASDEESAVTSRIPTFLRWLVNNTALKSDALLLQMSDYVNRMSAVSANTSVMWSNRALQRFIDIFEDPEELRSFENFLNSMGIEGKLVCEKMPDGRSQLYFKHDKLIPFFETASSGTMSAFNFYRRLKINKNPSLLYLDEFDAFYHYEMSENLVLFIKKTFPQCQVLFTSHNTNLLTNRLWRPDCLFILSRAGQLTALCDATPRELREGHNLEKMYISGEFDRYE